jgi:hypothetical protein
MVSIVSVLTSCSTKDEKIVLDEETTNNETTNEITVPERPEVQQLIDQLESKQNVDSTTNKEEQTMGNQVVASRRTFKLLAVGNSFSDNSLEYVYQVLNSFGVSDIVVANLSLANCDIETHANNAATDANKYVYRKNTTGSFVDTHGTRMSTAFEDEDWQYITLQQSSALSGVEDSYTRLINALNEYIRNDIASDKLSIGWHMTWAYAQNSTHEGFKNYNNSQREMYNAIVSCVQNNILPNENFDFIIPAGTAIQNARTSYVGDTLTTDGYHLEDLGKFIASLTYVLEITNWPLEDMDMNLIPQKFMPYIDVILESVTNALENDNLWIFK